MIYMPFESLFTGRRPDGARMSSDDMDRGFDEHEAMQRQRVHDELNTLRMRLFRLSTSSLKSVFVMTIRTKDDILNILLRGFYQAIDNENRLFLPKAEVQRYTDMIDDIELNLRNNNISASLNDGYVPELLIHIISLSKMIVDGLGVMCDVSSFRSPHGITFKLLKDTAVDILAEFYHTNPLAETWIESTVAYLRERERGISYFEGQPNRVECFFQIIGSLMDSLFKKLAELHGRSYGVQMSTAPDEVGRSGRNEIGSWKDDEFQTGGNKKIKIRKTKKRITTQRRLGGRRKGKRKRTTRRQ